MKFALGLNQVILCVVVFLFYCASPEMCMAGNGAYSILIKKRDHRLTLAKNGKILKQYSIALGKGGLERKTCQGDNRTPEGAYAIDSKVLASGYHRALHISYPAASDIDRAKAAGCAPGGDIMIHGIKNGLGWIGSLHRFVDWTRGCIAVTNPEIEEIWNLITVGTPVEIRP